MVLLLVLVKDLDNVYCSEGLLIAFLMFWNFPLNQQPGALQMLNVNSHWTHWLKLMEVAVLNIWGAKSSLDAF